MPAADPCTGLGRLVPRLVQQPQHTIAYFEGTKLVRKPFPSLHDDIRQVQERLRSWGVGAGTRVGIRGPNSYEWVVHELALLDLGCVTVTLPNAEFGPEPPETLAERYGLELMLAAEPTEPTEPIGAGRHEWLAPLTLASGQDRRVLRSPPKPLGPDVFTVVFSSGTTGALKAIQINQRATDEILAEFRNHYEFQPDDAILVALPLSTFQQRIMLYCALWYGFDAIVVEPSPLMFVALKAGRPTIMGGPPAFYELLENRFRAQPAAKRHVVRALSAVIRRALPSGLRQAALRRLFRPAHDAYGGRMRLMLSGSAPLRTPTSEIFAMAGLPLFQLYGLTESGFIAWNKPGANRVGSVGKPVYPGSVAIADDGEVLVRWPSPQSSGYLGEPAEVERAAFRPDGWVATGDLGRFDEDGYLYLVGRKKDIIVTRSGYKIAPSPLEQQIQLHPDVAQAVLIGGGELDYVAAVLVLRPHASDAADRVRRHVDDVNRGLPTPSHVVRVIFADEPFTRENGMMTTTLKLNRAAVAGRYAARLS